VILLLVSVVVFALAAAAGADLRRLATVRLRASWLILVALGLQLVVFALPVRVPLLSSHVTAVHVASYALLVLFATVNVRRPGLPLAALGLALNALVICANGGRMPVRLSAWEATGYSTRSLREHGVYNNNVLGGHGTHLSFLGDVFPLPSWLPFASAFSIGDVLLVVGAAVFIWMTCRRDRSDPSPATVS
jgi:hypothetical protein